MKPLLSCFLLAVFALPAHAQFGNILNRVENAATNRANSKIDQGINKGFDKAEQGVKNSTKKPADSSPQSGKTNSGSSTDTNAGSSDNGNAPTASATPGVAAPSMRSYTNYDFVPGNKIIFADDFHTDQDGEFAEHWDLKSGQAVLNKFGDGLVMKITDGNSGIVMPLMKSKSYLPKEYTIEYDYYQTPGAYALICMLNDAEGNEILHFRGSREGGTVRFQSAGEGRDLDANLPAELQGEQFNNRWHHIAFIQKGRSLKLYIDQFRVVNVPNNTGEPASVSFGGIGNQEDPLIFKNVRIAEGGGANMIGQKFGEGKYISYGINFDYGKATIKPESMGELTAIQKYLTENSGSRFEVGGYTDADGSDASNMTLSQKRADAVKAQLTSMGIEANRLTAKGYGETKPVGDNATFEGKAQNRRVEFVKQ